jgi:hypothetical protein
MNWNTSAKKRIFRSRAKNKAGGGGGSLRKHEGNVPLTTQRMDINRARTQPRVSLATNKSSEGPPVAVSSDVAMLRAFPPVNNIDITKIRQTTAKTDSAKNGAQDIWKELATLTPPPETHERDQGYLHTAPGLIVAEEAEAETGAQGIRFFSQGQEFDGSVGSSEETTRRRRPHFSTATDAPNDAATAVATVALRHTSEEAAAADMALPQETLLAWPQKLHEMKSDLFGTQLGQLLQQDFNDCRFDSSGELCEDACQSLLLCLYRSLNSGVAATDREAAVVLDAVRFFEGYLKQLQCEHRETAEYKLHSSASTLTSGSTGTPTRGLPGFFDPGRIPTLDSYVYSTGVGLSLSPTAASFSPQAKLGSTSFEALPGLLLQPPPPAREKASILSEWQLFGCGGEGGTGRTTGDVCATCSSSSSMSACVTPAAARSVREVSMREVGIIRGESKRTSKGGDAVATISPLPAGLPAEVRPVKEGYFPPNLGEEGAEGDLSLDVSSFL